MFKKPIKNVLTSFYCSRQYDKNIDNHISYFHSIY